MMKIIIILFLNILLCSSSLSLNSYIKGEVPMSINPINKNDHIANQLYDKNDTKNSSLNTSKNTRRRRNEDLYLTPTKLYEKLYRQTRFKELDIRLSQASSLSNKDHYIKGLMLLATCQFNEAINELSALKPQMGLYPHYYLGNAYYYLSDYSKSATHYKKYIKESHDSHHERSNVATHRLSLSKLALNAQISHIETPIRLPLLKKQLDKRRLVTIGTTGKFNDVHFFIDSGAPENIIDKSFAKKLNVRIQYNHPLIATDLAGTKVTLYSGILPHLKLGDAVYNNIPVLIFDLEGVQSGLGIDGHFGGILSPQRLFRGHTFEIDYLHRRATISPKKFIQKRLDKYTSTGMYLISGNTYISGKIHNSPNGAILVDSGSRSSKVYTDIKKHTDISDLEYSPINPSKMGLSIGLGGISFTDKLEKATYDFNGYAFKKENPTLISDYDNDFDFLGMLSNDFIKKHYFIYDFDDYRFYFKKFK